MGKRKRTGSYVKKCLDEKEKPSDATVLATDVSTNKVSLSKALVVDSKLSAPLSDWLSTCPNPDELKRAVKRTMWLNSKQKCRECEEPFARKDLRPDVFSAWADGKLMCRTCWDFFQGYTTSVKMKWPDKLPENELVTEVELYDGIMIDRTTKQRFGTVKGYNPATKCAQLVTLDCMPECAESGIVDPDCEVIQTEKGVPLVVKDDESCGSASDDDE